MFCGKCNDDECCFEVILLTPEHISPEYLDSLNDKEHLVHSRNKVNTHTYESQILYIQKFDFVNDFILGVRCLRSKRMIGTSTLTLNRENQSINIGILIFKKYSKRGYGHLILKTISDFCYGIFPRRPQEIGTSFENHPMQKIALKVGFELQREDHDSKLVYYIRTFREQENLKFLTHPPSLVVASDAGSATHLASILKAYNICSPLRLSGPAVEIFRRFGVRSSEFEVPFRKRSGDYLLIGSSLFGGPESQALSDPALPGFRKIALLDHWVNYKERFHPSGLELPDTLLVTNPLAFMLAREQFRRVEVLEIPDFQLASVKLDFLSRVTTSQIALILVEPKSKTRFSEEFPMRSLENTIWDVRNLAHDRHIQKIVVRPHPSHTSSYVRELNLYAEQTTDLEISTNTNLTDDLIQADFVVGTHTYALYLASELGIPTFGYFSNNPNHWTHNFPKIVSI